MKLFKDKINSDIMLVKIQDSAIKNICFLNTRSFLFFCSFLIRLGIYKDGVQGNKNYVLEVGYEMSTLSGYMSTLYNHDVPLAVCLVRNNILKKNPGNLRKWGTVG